MTTPDAIPAPNPDDACGSGAGNNDDVVAALADLNVDVDSINIDELDVTASGLTSVRRCIEDGEIDLIICKDEDHAGGQGDDTDTGDDSIRVVGYVGADGVFVAGAPADEIVPCVDGGGCEGPTRCWEQASEPTAASPDAANDDAGLDYDSSGASYNATNPTALPLPITHLDVHVPSHSPGAIGSVTFGGVQSDALPINVGVMRFTLPAPVVVPAGGTVGLTFNGITGFWDHSESNTDNLWTGFDPIAVTFLTSEIERFTSEQCPDGTVAAYDSMGELVEFNPDGDWVQIECPNPNQGTIDRLQTLVNSAQVARRCYERPSANVDTDNLIDIGNGEPITTPIVIEPDESGHVEFITIRANNINAFGNHEGLPFAIEIDGTIYEYDVALSGLESAFVPPNAALPGNAPLDRSRFVFVVDLDVVAGQPITINYTDQGVGAGTGAGDPNNFFWSTGSDSDNGQVQPFGDGDFAQIALRDGATERWSQTDFADGTTVTFGPDGSIEDVLPTSGLVQIRCDECCNDGSETNALLTAILDELQSEVPEDRIDIEYLCNEDTGLVDRITTTVDFNGVRTIEVEATAYECSGGGGADIEVQRECRNGFVTHVAYLATEDGLSEVDAVATAEPCGQGNTHVIEGCIDGEILVDENGDPILDENGGRQFEIVSAYTVIDDNGDPLFPPRPLTDLGFREGGCC